MNKGPFIILFMGIGGMVFFGVLANWVVDNNPRVKKNLAYRQQLAAAFPVQRVSMKRDRDSFRMQVWVKPNQVEAEAPTASSELPASLSGLRRHFEAHFEARPAPARLEVEVLKQPLWGCRGKEQVLWRVGYDIAKEHSALKKSVAKSLGATVHHLEVAPENVLVIKSQKPRKAPSPEAFEAIAKDMSQALGGGWQRLEIWFGRSCTAFDGNGKFIETTGPGKSKAAPGKEPAPPGGKSEPGSGGAVTPQSPKAAPKTASKEAVEG